MLKKILIVIIISIIILGCLIMGWDLYCKDGVMHKTLEIEIPLLTKRETINLKSGNFFDGEVMRKLYLSKRQTKRILKEIENNNNWKKGEIDDKVEERLKFYTRENIYNKIPYVKNKYWIFTNRSTGTKDIHSIDEVINTSFYYAISFGLLDIDNNILYYYEYDR